ncbi:MAG: class I tRNA ligase family protein, partial [Planctomycetota bacterium]|nr:class I tRNA ligase family protein [Planctomycetota bacterium]
RFTLGHLEGEIADQGGQALEDRWIQSRLAAVTEEVSQALESYDFHDAAQALYRFTWDDYCDWYVEVAKRRLRLGEGADSGSPEAEDAARVRRTLGETLSALLRLLHPFTPYLTEALWEQLPSCFRSDGLIMAATWPEVMKRDPQAEKDFHCIQDAVRGFRNVRALLDLSHSDRPIGLVMGESQDICHLFESQSPLTSFLAGLDGIEAKLAQGSSPPSNSGTDIFDGGALFLGYGEGTDPSKLKGILEKKLQKVQNGVLGIEKKLGNERFVQNADPEIVESERVRMADLQTEASTLKANLAVLA